MAIDMVTNFSNLADANVGPKAMTPLSNWSTYLYIAIRATGWMKWDKNVEKSSENITLSGP
jgi:hypothetical protein